MFNLILFEPEIPSNTGNIIRLCSNTNASLHLIEPLGFQLDDKRLRRAGLDYNEFVNIKCYDSLSSCIKGLGLTRVYALSTKGVSDYCNPNYKKNDTFLFGPETRGLSKEIRDSSCISQVLKIPMAPKNRSINLSNAAAIVIYEAWRQLNFISE